MKKSYYICGFDCPNCASKAEAHLNKHPLIKSAVIDFSKDRLHVNYKDNEMDIDDILTVIHEVEDDDIRITELDDEPVLKKFFDRDFFFHLERIGFALLVIILTFTVFKDVKYYWYVFVAFLLSLIILSYDTYYSVIKKIIHKENPLDEELLMTITSVGAFVVGAITADIEMFLEADLVMILFIVGEMVEEFATIKSKKEISEAIGLRIDTANLLDGEEIKKVNPRQLEVNDVVMVSNGDVIPTDGEIIEGNALIDTSSLTGEFIPIEANNGLQVYSGYIIKSGSVKVRVTKIYKESAVSKILELITNSGEKKSKADRFVNKFARIYTPIIFAISMLTLIIGGAITNDWGEWTILGLKMLVVGCPCAIVISVPLAYFAAIGLASKNGIVVKGASYLDKLYDLKKVVLDKTGTLTEGVFEINKVSGEEKKVLKYLRIAESLSNHPIARAIVGNEKIENNASLIENYTEIAGFGISLDYKGEHILAGNQKLLEKYNIEFESAKEHGVIVYCAVNNKFVGYVVLSDKIKAESYLLIQCLKKDKIETILLTGDKEDNAKVLSDELGIDRYYSNLLPQDKVEHLENELGNKMTAYVGDGINDAASIKQADIGFAMGAIGSDVAVECADVVIMNDNPIKVYDSYHISKIARHVSIFNIVFAILVKVSIEVAALVTNLVGVPQYIPMWLAVLTDTGLTVLLVVNSLLILYRKLKHKSV